MLRNRDFESCLSPLRFRCFFSITTEYTIRRTRRPVWGLTVRFPSRLPTRTSHLRHIILKQSFLPEPNDPGLLPPSFPLSSRFLISPPNQLPSKTPAIEPLSVHGRSEKNPARRKREPSIRPIIITDRVKAGTSPPREPRGIKNATPIRVIPSVPERLTSG